MICLPYRGCTKVILGSRFYESWYLILSHDHSCRDPQKEDH